MIWAGSATATGSNSPGTSAPCASNIAGSLTSGSALYTAAYAYDNLDRLTSGPANGGSSYTYGDSAHLHAATSTSGGYSATYDAAGDMKRCVTAPPRRTPPARRRLALAPAG